MDQQMLTTVLTGATVLLGLGGYLLAIKRDLKDDIAKVDRRVDSLDNRIDGLTAHVDAGFQTVNTRLTALEQRTYDLSARLPPAPVATGTDDA